MRKQLGPPAPTLHISCTITCLTGMQQGPMSREANVSHLLPLFGCPWDMSWASPSPTPHLPLQSANQLVVF